ncbi:MAG: hypothetical protein JWM80_3896, partial [Cyanobacteria bacterium RYN_339]|nr:hypothetical protein [Cyanobacteria bacterium RYN_339]
MLNFRHTLSVSLSVSLAAVAMTACQPAMLQNQQAADSPTAVTQMQAPQVLPAGTMKGMVAKFEGGKFVPVENAEVKVEGTNAVAHTDAEGRYTIAGVAQGAYNVVATKDGWVSGKHEIYMNPVMGTPRVNLALNPSERALQAVPASVTVTVSGVVTDPRGSALGGASIKVLSNVGNNPAAPAGSGFNQTATADAAGFYTISIPGVAVSPTQPGQVQVTAFGTSPGGLKLETTDVYAFNLTTATLVANPQCKAFTQPGIPTWPNGSFAKEGTNSTIKADWLSSRSDEFYIELDCPATIGSGKLDQVYGVLPESAITINAATTLLPPNGVATYRIPFTMPGNVFFARLIPFGLTSQFGKISTIGAGRKSAAFVTNYTLGAVGTLGSLEDDIFFTGGAVVADATDATGLLNAGKLVSADTVNMVMTIQNRSTSVSQDLQLIGTAPIGTGSLTATYVPTPGGAAAQPAVTIPAGNITLNSATGAFTISGINMPLASAPAARPAGGAGNGQVAITIAFSAPVPALPVAGFQVSAMSVKMVSANLAKAAELPGTAGVSTSLPGSDFDIANITMGAKTFVDDGTLNNGIGLVKWTITPTGATAAGVIRVTDRVLTDSVVGSAAAITGTVVLPAAGTTMAFVGGDHIDFASELGPNSISILPNWDLETLMAFINATSVGIGVRAIRDAGNHFQLIRTVAGTTKKLEIQNTSSVNVATKLGVTLVAPGALPAVGTDGAIADAVGATALRVGGNAYVLGNLSSAQNPDKSVTTTFTLTPPAALGGVTTLLTPIDVTYRIIQGAGVAGTNLIHLGGGGAAPFGASITAVNTSQTPTNTG